MPVNPRVLALAVLGGLAAILIVGAVLTFTQPSTTVYLFIFPVATVGPSFVSYLAGAVMLIAGVALALVALRVAL